MSLAQNNFPIVNSAVESRSVKREILPTPIVKDLRKPRSTTFNVAALTGTIKDEDETYMVSLHSVFDVMARPVARRRSSRYGRGSRDAAGSRIVWAEIKRTFLIDVIPFNGRRTPSSP